MAPKWWWRGLVAGALVAHASFSGCVCHNVDDDNGAPHDDWDPPPADERVSGSTVIDGAGEWCSIAFGGEGDGTSWGVQARVAPGKAVLVPDLGGWGWEFVTQTSGPCHFEVFNARDFGRDQVTYGTGLESVVRVGRDGLADQDHGDTWRGRSVRIHGVAENPAGCRLRVGDALGDFWVLGDAPDLPRLPLVTGSEGADCEYTVYDDTGLAGPFVRLFGGVRGSYRMGWDLRSVAIRALDPPSDAPCVRADVGGAEGPCLPAARPPEGDGRDDDGDALDDGFEDWLAATFAPELRFDSRDTSAPSPRMVYEVFPAGRGRVGLRGGVLWARQGGAENDCHESRAGHTLPVSMELRDVDGWWVPVFVDFEGHARWADGEEHALGVVENPSADPACDFSEDCPSSRLFAFAGTHPVLYVDADTHGAHHDRRTDGSRYWVLVGDEAPECAVALDGAGAAIVPATRRAGDAPNNVGDADAPRLRSPAELDAAFRDYDLWLEDGAFCGGEPPGGEACGGLVLRDLFRPADDRPAPPDAGPPDAGP
jgi:hypothetical protein